MRPLALLLLLAAATLAAEPYVSPYSVKFTFPESELIGDLQGPRGDWKSEGSVAYSEWFSPATRKKFGSWGPGARHFPPPPGLAQKSAEWQRQRVIATALRFRGYSYQHHHIPDWEPPAGWPPGESPRTPARGIDCSNFTAFVYNQALGLKPTGAIREQAALTEVPGFEQPVPITRVELPSDYAAFPGVLRTGDLLYIRGKAGGEITHVVFWVGAIGRSKNDVPLILDSTGEGRRDETGAAIPDGVQLRPFTPTSWYCRNASHALRLVPER